MRLFAILLTLLLTVPAPAEETKVLILGVFHFGNPGLDYVKSEVPDVMSPERQKEIAALTEALARFAPTKIMVEAPASSDAALNAVYRKYREGTHALRRDEVEQLGFRLAKRMNHESVFAIDVKAGMNLGGVIDEAKKSDPAFLASFDALMKDVIGPQQRMQVERPLRDALRFMNDPANVRRGHGGYVEMARVGSSGNPIGAEQTAIWYARNIKIFANLARAAKAGDRILVIYGSGHTAILQQLVRDMPGMAVVEANGFL